MRIPFSKYQGTGNDFILIDNRLHHFSLTKEQITFLCHRQFGIGADGLMLLEPEPGVDFKMVYFNSDGNESSMCGNGGRCISAFAHHLGIVDTYVKFMATDGLHEASIGDNNLVSLKMKDVKSIEQHKEYFFLDTGSPHYVEIVPNVLDLNVYQKGRDIRYSEPFAEQGTNVNFIEKINENVFVRTYERGVENETLSCGTGVTAAALVASLTGISTHKNSCLIQTKGGALEVSFEKVLENTFYNIWLKGPANLVFEGQIDLAL
jgi:diaminopimelate epimerase